MERIVMLQTVDNLWKDHLLSMDHLKEGIGLRGYAQQNPLLIYKKEGFEMFQEMIARIKEETLAIMFRVQMVEPDEDRSHSKTQGAADWCFPMAVKAIKKKPVKREDTKVGRNDPVPLRQREKI